MPERSMVKQIPDLASSALQAEDGTEKNSKGGARHRTWPRSTRFEISPNLPCCRPRMRSGYDSEARTGNLKAMLHRQYFDRSAKLR